MNNVCPVCGMYEVEREVIPGHGDVAVATCSDCGSELPFRRKPLFVVTGASGAGKTAACQECVRRETGFTVIESDILWGAIDAEGEAGLDRYWSAWLRLIKNLHQVGPPVLLVGTLVPAVLERRSERRYIGEIRYLALVVDREVQERRLRGRPAWRESGSDEFIARHVAFNRWFVDDPAASAFGLARLDVSTLTVAEVADAVLDWARRC